jgi:hypothetical protein
VADHVPDLFIPEITPEIRARVIADLREEADKYVEAGRDAFPGMCGVAHLGGESEAKPFGLYNEEMTLKLTRAVFTRMLDAAEGIELYQPGNGTAGEAFMSRWCSKCTKDAAHRANPDLADGCNIIADTMALDVDDPDYPREWRQDGKAGPRCTAFEPEDS